MALTTWYSAGTVSVDNGSAIVTGTGTLWGDDAIMPGDLFCDPAQPAVPPQRVKEVTADGTLELWAPWPGTTLTDAAYEIRYVGIIERSTAQTRTVLEQLGAVNAFYDRQVDVLADRAAYDDEWLGPGGLPYRILVSDTGDGRSAIYSKISPATADWSDPAYVTGPAVTLDIGDVTEVAFGDPPAVTLDPVGGGYTFNFDLPAAPTLAVGTVTTGAPGSSVIVTANPVAGGYEFNFTIPQGNTGDIDGVTGFWQARITTDADAATARTGLGATTVGDGLFTAADAAAARTLINVLGVGDYGIGGGAFNIPDFTSADINVGRLFRSLSGATDGPGVDVSGVVLPFSGTLRTLFLATDLNGNVWMGDKNGATGTPIWQDITAELDPDKAFRRGNILGTVSEASGVPTGAIIEQGSNANGDYVRFADGTQMCWARLPLEAASQANGSIYRTSSNITWTLPIIFLDSPVAFGAAEYVSGGTSWLWLNAFDTYINYRVLSGVSGSEAIPTIVAIGRWF